MRPTLFILLAVAAILLGYRLFVYQPPPPPPTEEQSEIESVEQAPPPPEYEQPAPAGVVPKDPPEFAISHEVRQVGKQHRLHIFLQEKHGWWADRIYVTFWYQDKDAKTGDWVKYTERTEFIPRAIEFGKTLEHAFTIYVTDLPRGKPKGTTENWGVRVASWDPERVRAPATAPPS